MLSTKQFDQADTLYCGDAFQSRRKDTGAMAIQVGSFTSRERADAFAAVMSDRVGNAEVGEPTVR